MQKSSVPNSENVEKFCSEITFPVIFGVFTIILPRMAVNDANFNEFFKFLLTSFFMVK